MKESDNPMPTSNWWQSLNKRYLFFTGKGGVGKTSLACATSLALCEAGRRVLIVSTDPASNLDEVFGLSLTASPQPLPTVPGLWACNLDPAAAAAAYREKVVGPYRGVLPPAVIRNMEEQFSGACTTELATFGEFVALMADDQLAGCWGDFEAPLEALGSSGRSPPEMDISPGRLSLREDLGGGMAVSDALSSV